MHILAAGAPVFVATRPSSRSPGWPWRTPSTRKLHLALGQAAAIDALGDARPRSASCRRLRGRIPPNAPPAPCARRCCRRSVRRTPRRARRPAISSSFSASIDCTSRLASRLIWSERVRVATRCCSSAICACCCSRRRLGCRPMRLRATRPAGLQPPRQAAARDQAAAPAAPSAAASAAGARLPRDDLETAGWGRSASGSIQSGSTGRAGVAPILGPASVRPFAAPHRWRKIAMSEAHLFAIGILLAWLAGIRVYLTVFGVGLAGALGWLDLPPALQVAQSPWVLGVSGAAGGGGVLRRQDPRRRFGLGPAAHAAARAGRGLPRRVGAVARRRTRRGHARHRCRRRVDQPPAEVRLARVAEYLARNRSATGLHR